MSEKTLSELVEARLEMEGWRAYRHEQQPWIAMFDARIAQAEAAERAVQALVVWMHDSTTKNWEPVMDALQEHADQGRVVRKLEEGT